MSQNDTPQVRGEEAELNDEALEQVAGGCQVDSHLYDPWTKPTVSDPVYVDNATY